MSKGALQIVAILGFERKLHPVIRIADPWIRPRQKIGVPRKTLVEVLSDRAFASRSIYRPHVVGIGREASEQRGELGLENLRDARQNVDVVERRGWKAQVACRIQTRALGHCRHLERGGGETV